MKLEEIREEIDRIDSMLKPLILERMGYSKLVAEAKKESGSDVFVPKREQEIIEKWTDDIEGEWREEYAAILRHLISVSRRYQYGILQEMQEQVCKTAVEESGIDRMEKHSGVVILFTCPKYNGNLNLYIDMIQLNQIPIREFHAEEAGEELLCEVTLEGKLDDENMKRLLCQLAKEAPEFEMKSLIL